MSIGINNASKIALNRTAMHSSQRKTELYQRSVKMAVGEESDGILSLKHRSVAVTLALVMSVSLFQFV